MEDLLILLRSFAPMSAALEKHLRSIITCRHVRKRDILIKAGEIAKDIYYIRKGLVRSFHCIKGTEMTNAFRKENDICFSVTCFFKQKPSLHTLKAVEDCELLGIKYQELETTYALFPEFNRHGRLITDHYLIRSEKWYQDAERESASANYANLIEEDPDLVRRVPSIYLASYLNVSNTEFDEIRSEYAKGILPKK